MRTKEYRNSDKFLRNEFESSGVWGFSLIKKQEILCHILMQRSGESRMLKYYLV